MEYLKGKTSVHPLIPAMTGMLSKAMAMPVAQPFEQYATRLQGGLPSEGTLWRMSGLKYTFRRERAFSGVFWSCNEYLFKQFRENKRQFGFVSSVTIAAFCSSLVGGLVSYPFDALRTWKIGFPEKFEKKGTLGVIAEIRAERGTAFLFSGSNV